MTTMRATISQLDIIDDTLWEGEALRASRDGNKGELVIRGGKCNSGALAGVVTSMVRRHQLTVEIEDNETGCLVWRGHVGSAQFQVAVTEHLECSLVMLLDDWYSIVHRFTKFSSS
jgi:hypothetical protein